MRRKLIIAIVAVVIGGQVLYGAELAYLTAHPRMTTVEEAGIPDPTLRGLPPAENITLTTRDGVRLAGWYFPAESQTAVLLTHARGQNRASMLGHASTFIDAGYAVLLLDFRSHGNSQRALSSMGWLEAEDVRAGFTFLHTEQGYGQIVGVGLSYGAVAILYAALEEPGLTPLVLEGMGTVQLRDDLHLCTPADAALLPATISFYGFDTLFHGGPAPLNMPHALEQAAPNPVLLIHGGASRSERCQHRRMAGQGPHISGWLVDGAGHVGARAHDPAAYADRVLSFLEAHGATP